MTRTRSLVALLVGASILVGACSSAATTAPSTASAAPPATPAPGASAATSMAPAPTASLDKTPTTITVWDYYGEATPFSKEVIASFEKEYPWITVKYEALDWDTMHQKFTVAVSSGTGPDVATLDMTWIPTFGSQGALADLSQVSGGTLNGEPITSAYTKGALEAMTLNGHYVTTLFDFDTYALYYRADQFEQKGIQVPTNWDQLRAAAKQLAQNGKFQFAVQPDTFHWSQFLFQNGGSILNADETAAAFNSPEGIASMDYLRGFLTDKSGILWTTDQGEITQGLKDERVGMYLDGPFRMGQMKQEIPEQAGKWKVALAPYAKQPGSYLGGTGLSISVNSKHQQQAWLFIQYMLRLPQQLLVATLAGAAPATTAALQSPELNKPDAYFGGEQPYPVFLDTMATATHFPYVTKWDDIMTTMDDACVAALSGSSTSKAALDDAAQKVNDLLKQ